MTKRLIAVGRKYPDFPTMRLVVANDSHWDPIPHPADDGVDHDLMRKIKKESEDL